MSHRALFLLVEDSEEDTLLIRRAFRKAKILNRLKVVRNADDAILYLSGEGNYANRKEFPLPSIVLLDLKMPGKDGFEILSWVRRRPALSQVRVVVLTGSQLPEDVDHAYQLGANSFLVKPVDFDSLVDLMRAVSGYWLWMDRAAATDSPPKPDPQDLLRPD